MFFIYLFSRFTERFARVFFLVLPCPCANLRSRIVTCTCTNANVTVVTNILVNKTWENRVMLFLHGQLALHIRPQCWPRVLKLTCFRLVNFEHPRLSSQPNIQCYPIMTKGITLQDRTGYCKRYHWHTSYSRFVCHSDTADVIVSLGSDLSCTSCPMSETHKIKDTVISLSI